MPSKDDLDTQARHVESTTELILEVLESQRIPHIIAIAALTEAISIINWSECKNCGEFYIKEKLTQDSMYKSTPTFLMNKLMEYYKTLSPNEKVIQALAMLKVGPSCMIIKDGKITGVKQ